MGITVDTSQLNRLAATLDTAGQAIPDSVAEVIKRGALNIKKDAARRASGLAHAPAYPRSISFDFARGLSGPSAEIGPDKGRRQGALGNLIEYGSVNNGPRPHLGPALDAEAPKLQRYLEDAVLRALGL
ncbi:hypothetical protein [Actinoplanes palleronii]|uniref:HK97 gp10 family phage protein n=1 Tax=Actinoplanes palleronii TaxID=113570 RepID=A0ABQ4BJ76_9ACTN|nr:hypothetical protein [Actinoplanes palleronii]GIE70733.1 hypothetical protein Apa02nite_068410 [Actinoplanes palleronii]